MPPTRQDMTSSVSLQKKKCRREGEESVATLTPIEITLYFRACMRLLDAHNEHLGE